ncbi:hypothetical protein N0V86_005471 [Didymella sp. IMI 355093]|nr:hypothetical protein N0V86_005471 [Didymella sp. IMI 355093]
MWDLRTVSIGTVLRLNGPGSLQGAENVTDLALTVSIQFADRPLVEKAEIEFSDLLDALACRTLRSLRIQFINDGYHIGDDLSTELNTGYFLEQLSSVQTTLETLSITLETTEDDGELDWLVDMCQHPTKSLKHFAALKSLTIPQPFVFDGRTASWNTEDNCQPNELPPRLEQLELLFPHESVEEWAQGFLSENFYTASSPAPAWEFVAGKRSLKKLILTCREDVGNGIGVSYFTDDVDEIWWTLSTDYGIETEIHDQQRATKENLAGLYEDQSLNEEDSETDDEDIDGEDWQKSCSDHTVILAFLRNVSKHSFGRTSEQIGIAMNWSVERVDKAVENLHNDGNVDVRFEGALQPTIYFISANEEMLENDRAYGVRDNSNHVGRPKDWPQHPRPGALARHRIAILRCLRGLPHPGIEEGLTESELNDELKLDPKLIQDAMFQLLDAGFIESRSNSEGARTVVFKRESHELKGEDVDNDEDYTLQSSSVALSDQTLILNFLRLYHHTGQTPIGVHPNTISEAVDIPLERVREAGVRLLQDGNIRSSNIPSGTERYLFIRESEEMVRQDRLKEEFLQRSDGWETDESMPELEEY